MSLFSTMQTSISGMAAQSNALSTVGDNIANASTTGYKRAGAQFETLLGENATSDYQSGGVQTHVRYGVSAQGTLQSTTSATDLAISGNGFFIVNKDGQTGQYLTRAGSFVPDSDGHLVNTAGYQLQGYAIGPNGASTSLSTIQLSQNVAPVASTSGKMTANLPASATATTGHTPADNKADSKYTNKTSITVYDNLGTADVLDVYMTKTADNTWQATAYMQNAASSSGGFPYSSAAVGSANLTFDPTTGALTSASSKSLTATIPNGNSTGIAIDLSATTQLAGDFNVSAATANGNAPSKFDHVKIDTDGTLTQVFSNGQQVAAYKIPLATVISPDNLTPISGNVYQVSTSSGDMQVSSAGQNGAGIIQSDSLEESTVDLATELTNMIVAQRGYEANSKVLQASSDLLSVLNRLTTN